MGQSPITGVLSQSIYEVCSRNIRIGIVVVVYWVVFVCNQS